MTIRAAVGAGLLLAVLGAEARAGGFRSLLGFSGGGGSSAGCACGDDDDVLRPELAHWVLQQSQCKQSHHDKSRARAGCDANGYPILPYGGGHHRGVTAYPQSAGFPY